MLRLLSVLVLCLSPTVLYGAIDIHVVDESGKPIDKFSALTQTTLRGRAYLGNDRGRDGKFTIYPTPDHGRQLRVMVSAPGYAATVQAFTLGDERVNIVGPAEIALTPGDDVRLRLQLPRGMELPSGLRPHVYLTEFADHARDTFRPKSSGRTSDIHLDRTDDGEFVFQLPADNRPFLISLHKPGWLRFFEAGPFTAEDVVDGRLTVPVPRPASIEAKFDASDFAAADLPFDEVQISFMWFIPGKGGSMMPQDEYKRPPDSATFHAGDLAPGRYRLWMSTLSADADQPRAAGQIDLSRFYDVHVLNLRAGNDENIVTRYQPFDPEAYRGNRVTKIKILNQDGSPVVGKTVSVTYFDGHYGSMPVPSGPLSDEGVLWLEGITDRQPETTDKPPYSIQVDRERLGMFRIAPDEGIQTFEFRMSPRVGDPAPDVQFLDLRTGETSPLGDRRGHIVFLEFWATWCGPCQPAMAKLNELAGGSHDDLLDEVRIVPISVDEIRDVVLPHVQSRGWTNFEHYWSSGSEDPAFFSSPAAQAFGVNGVPTALLLDRDGTIVWRGHPNGIDLPAEVQKLLVEDAQ